MNQKVAVFAFAVYLGPAVCTAQALKVDHFTQEQLLAKAQDLNEKAASSGGAASVKLTEYPNHYTMVALRHRDGGAELHESFADLFFVIQGHATLVTGGEIEDPKKDIPGEVCGSSVKGGERTQLGQGDVVHIPAGLSHQLLVHKDDTFIYFVVKVKEK
jgi:mannose-6-phosphate isomerase-like protein (cupin superfamily)